MRQHEVFIGDRAIGTASKVFVIAEIGINHDGSFEQARKLIDAAAQCGADAVKFQSFRADRLLVPSRDRFAHQGKGAESAYQLFRRMELSWEEQEKLKLHADARGIVFLSTPFDEESTDFLDHLGVPAFKIASADINYLPLLRHVASKKKPVLLSTGMSYLSEVADAIWTLKSSDSPDIVLLHCISSYPAPPESLNLRAIQTLRDHFDLLVGYSDHSQGILFPLMAVAMGATVLEKHFTLDKNAEGPDHRVSLDPEELDSLIRNLRSVESSLGDGRKRPCREEEQNRLMSRRSIVAAVDIRAYEAVAPWMLAFKRAPNGLDPREAEKIIGLRARRNIGRDTILQWEDLGSAEKLGLETGIIASRTDLAVESTESVLEPGKRNA